jgi:hypothetical protein
MTYIATNVPSESCSQASLIAARIAWPSSVRTNPWIVMSLVNHTSFGTRPRVYDDVRKFLDFNCQFLESFQTRSDFATKDGAPLQRAIERKV